MKTQMTWAISRTLALAAVFAQLIAQEPVAKPQPTDPQSVLLAIERLHGRFLSFVGDKPFSCAYEGLLTRNSNKGGFVRESCGSWLFISGDHSARFRLLLCSPTDRSDCRFKIDGVEFHFQIQGKGEDADKAPVAQLEKVLGCTLTKFQTEIQNGKGIEPAKNP